MTTLQALFNDTSWRHGDMRRIPRRAFGAQSARRPTLLVSPPRIAAPVKDGWHVFDARIIAQFRADTKYTTFVIEGREYMISEPLHALEQRLRPHGFLRVHRAALVNLSAVQALLRHGRQASLELASGTAVPVSRRLTPDVYRALGITFPPKLAIRGKAYLRVSR